MSLAMLGLLLGMALPREARAGRDLVTGFGSHYYQSADPATRSHWLNRTIDARAGIVKLNLQWYNIARFALVQRPADASDPRSSAYEFGWVDDAVTDASEHGLETLLLVGGTPPWAQAPGRPPEVDPTVWNPNPSDLADFMRAVATRYSGNFDPDGAGPRGRLPAITAVEVWNEPNASGSLSPQFEGRADAAGPIYRGMLNAAYDAVKAVDPKILVVAGGTNPYGARPGGPYPPDLQLVPPVTFWQDVLCVHPVKGTRGKAARRAKAKTRFARMRNCPAPAKFDVLAHHPVNNSGAGPLAHGPLPGDVTTPDLGKIVRVLRAGEKAGTTLPGDHQVWVTEFWWDSQPPNTAAAGLETQARWIQQSLYLFWKAGASAAINLVIGDADYLNNRLGGYQGGAYFQDGDPKPALTAFQFPFVTDRLGKRRLRAWGRSPSAGRLVIQRRAGGGWRIVKALRVREGEVFSTVLSLQGRQNLRARVGSMRSLVWNQR
jgi:hypothetical protein